MAVRTISFRSDEFGALLPDSLESRGILVLNVILWKPRAEVRRTPLGRLGASRLRLSSLLSVTCSPLKCHEPMV